MEKEPKRKTGRVTHTEHVYYIKESAFLVRPSSWTDHSPLSMTLSPWALDKPEAGDAKAARRVAASWELRPRCCLSLSWWLGLL